MSSYQYTTIIVILSSLMSACGLTPKKPTDSNLARNGYIEIERWLDAAITRRMKKADITGLGIALVDQDRIVLHKAYGWADKAANRPVSRDSRFRAGSVTKPFTSIAVHQLAERGAIDLDAPLSDSIAEFRIGSRFPDASEPTLRQVLSHYAGLPSDNLNGMWTNKPANLDSVSEYLATQYLTSSPGTVMAYSNLGYSMAGLAIERVSGLPYAEFMQQRVLDPLQMTASNVMFNTSHSTMSESYIDGEHVIEPGLRDLPAGGLVTTTGDLSKMVMAILNNGNLPGSKIEQLIAPHTLNSMVSVPTFSSPQSFGNLSALGWIRQSGILPRGDDLIWHNGQTLAHSALVQISRNAGLGIVLLSNSPAVEALDQIAKELIDLAYTVKFGAGVEKNQSPQAISNEQLPGSAAAPEGAFASIAGLVKLTPSGNNFNARLAARVVTRLS